MASSEVDQKFLGTFAKNIGNDNPLLSSMLFKVLGLSVILSRQLVEARKLRRTDPSAQPKESLDLCLHIIWLTREGLRIVEQYIMPMVSKSSELKVLSYKMRASFYHVYVLFHNQSSLNPEPIPQKRPSTPPGLTSPQRARQDKGKAPELASPCSDSGQSPQPPPPLQGGPVGGTLPIEPPPANFLVPAQEFVPIALQCFREASELSEKHLWGSHPLRLSVKVEFTTFLYDCMHDYEASRNLAKATIAEVYKAQEGMDDAMFEDAAELVGILGKISKRGEPGNVDVDESTAGLGGGGSTPGIGNVSRTGSGTGSGSERTIGPDAIGVAALHAAQPVFPSSDIVNPI